MGLFANLKKDYQEVKQRIAEKNAQYGKRLFSVSGKNFNSIYLREKSIEYCSPEENEIRFFEDINNVTLEDGTELESRVTATRLLVLGVFAFAAKKQTGGTKYIVVEGDDFLWDVEVDKKHVTAARQFVMQAKKKLKKV